MKRPAKPLLLSLLPLSLVGIIGLNYAAILSAAVFSGSSAYLETGRMFERLSKAGISSVLLFFGITGFFSPVADTLMLIPSLLEPLMFWPNIQVLLFTIIEMALAVSLFSKWDKQAAIGSALILTFITFDVLMLNAFQNFARDATITLFAWSYVWETNSAKKAES